MTLTFTRWSSSSWSWGICFFVLLSAWGFADNSRPRQLISTTNNIWGISGDNFFLYWAEMPSALFSIPRFSGKLMRLSHFGGVPTTLVSNMDYAVRTIEAGNGFVVWTESAIAWGDPRTFGAVRMMRTSPTLGPVVTIAADPSWGTFAGLPSLAIDKGFVYFAVTGSNTETGGAIYRAAIDPMNDSAGPIQLLIGSQRYPNSIVVDEVSVYWSNSDCWGSRGAINKMNKAGGEQPTILQGGLGEVSAITADSDFVYYGIWNGGIYRIPKSGGSVQSVVDINLHPDKAFACGALCVDSQYVYYGNLQHYHHYVARVVKQGGTPEILVLDPESSENPLLPWDLMVDDTGLYFSHCPTCWPPTGSIYGYVSRLTLSIETNHAILTFTNPHAMFSLQTSTNLSFSQWAVITNITDLGNSVFQGSQAMQSPNAFYRLKFRSW